MHRTTLPYRHRPTTYPTFSLTGLARRLFSLVLLARQRRALKHLDGHLLDDIGISPEAARAEAERPFWDAPPHWRL